MKIKVNPKKLTVNLLIILASAAAGFLYYKFVGCVSGTCPITSNPYASSAYGALIGLVLTQLSFKKNDKTNQEREKS